VRIRDGRVYIRLRRDSGNYVPRRKEEKGQKILDSIVGVLQLGNGQKKECMLENMENKCQETRIMMWINKESDWILDPPQSGS
jgi:hypothetical protein